MVAERPFFGRAVPMSRPCAFPGCPNEYTGKTGGGLCNSHYWQKFKGRELTPLSYRRNQCEPWLLAHVDHDGDECLIWPFQRYQDSGMPAVKYKGKQGQATRVMCELAHGKPPTPKHQAAHSCGKGHLGCINPNHLRWATAKENAADKVAHGTVVRGERMWQAKLNEAAVRTIRSLAGTVSQAELGRRFGVGQNAINKVLRGITWRHI